MLLIFYTLNPSGDVPAEDPDHSSVLRLHAGPQAGRLPVDLARHPDGWSGSGAGGTPSPPPIPQRLSADL